MQLLTYSVVIFFNLILYAQCAPVSVTKGEQNLYQERIMEGDILLPPKEKTLTGKGVGSKYAYNRWAKGVIPYEFAPNISANHTAFIVEQMRAMENMTMVNNAQCIQFRERNATDPYYLTIFNGTGCYAPVGAWGNLNTTRAVSLMHGSSSTCMISGIIQHELMHALGFYHEQSRPDRDAYVQILWSNINPGQANNFVIYNESTVTTQMTSYDYGSVMHYEWNAFAINSSAPTIIPIQNASAYIGQRIGLSPIDILEIQRYYNCVATPTTTVTTTTVSLTTVTTLTTATTNTVTSSTSVTETTTTSVTPVTTTSETTATTTSETTTTETTTESRGIHHVFPISFQLFVVALVSFVYLHSRF